ncbi:damage-control phosphatase ARMT1 family protein [Streptomyces sp. NBC_01775]|uniref:damage-control phosphatase ARMT1 family protein n=1 Tax=Streptomyces sp. NBC_01775 TaxID=2975939 RepID=UPI002DD7C730|nr:damage-control phosphatase ARMT1 family protein [Streptomyces sp. NBC_01775]WSB75300.1 damage-control phosphatase ARMT1 family protein [Streptomyces sp. NBC_01775]
MRQTREAAPVIVSSEPGTFAYGVWHERHPALVQRLKDAFPYPPAQAEALDALLDETLHGTLAPLPGDADDAALWNGPWDGGHYGKRWTEAPFLWAESYFYRRLLEATGYAAEPDGPGAAWRGVDPFAPFKDAELAGEAVDAQFAALDSLEPALVDERTDALLLSALWGNRADLGFLITAAEDTGPEGPLVADDREQLRALLRSAGERGGRIVLVADNAGRELIPDLLLAAHLLESGRAAQVSLHVKPHPYYVSDAVTPDVLAALRRMAAAPGAAGRAGHRLWNAVGQGRLEIRTHPFSCAPLGYDAMPDTLREDFASAALTLLKGDLNYRRLIGDRHWPPDTPFAEVTGYFPGPVAALRTLKSDTVAGLAPGTVAALEATGEKWRTSGAHALIQVRE